MTNLMLSVLGVLLATITAVLAIDYGGEYYQEVRQEAELASGMNALEQTKTAMDAYKMQYLRDAASINDLIAVGLMDEMPHLQGKMEFKSTWSSYRYNGLWQKGVVLTSVPPEICELHNDRVGFINGFTGKPADVTLPTGCYSSGEGTNGVIFLLIDL